MTDNTQSEALRLADELEVGIQFAPSIVQNERALRERSAAELRRLHAENVALQRGYDATQLEIDHLRGVTKSKLLAQPVAWMVYLPSIDTQHLYYSQEDMGYVDDVTNHADAEVTPLYEMAAPKAEVAPAGEYPPLPTGSAWCGDDDVRDFGAGAGESALMFEPTQTQHVPLFTADQMRAYVDADRAMRAQAAPAAVAGQCEDAIELLGKYKELCEEIKRGDSYHLGRIDSAISVLAQTAPQPSPAPQADSQPAPVAQGDARAEQALLKVLTAVQRYLPPDGPSAKDTLAEIIGIIDPLPLGDQKGKA